MKKNLHSLLRSARQFSKAKLAASVADFCKIFSELVT